MKHSAQLLLLSNVAPDVTPASIAVVSGSGQSANCGAPYALPLVAIVKNAGGTPLSGVSVTFTAPASGASGTFASTGTNSEVVGTNAAGQATSSVFTANGTGGASAYTVTATAGALSCNFSLTNNWTYSYYIQSLNPGLWFRNTEPTGTTATNSGSLGVAQNGTHTAVTVGQAGKLSVCDACLYDGATSLTTVPAGAYGNYAAFTAGFLINPSGWGESNSGRLFQFNSASLFLLSLNNTLPVQAYRAATTNAISRTTNGVTLSSWQWIFATYDNAGDRKIRLYFGIAGVVTECSYYDQVAATGTMIDLSGVAMILGNNAAAGLTQSGLIDEIFLISSVITPMQMGRIVTLSGM